MGESIPQQAAQEMDNMLTGVMPDTWVGHARLKINEADLSDKQRNFAMRLTERLSEKHPDKSTETLAELALKKAREL